MKPSLSRVERAADQLAALDLGRNSATLIRWLAVKWAGGRPGNGDVALTRESAEKFCAEYFGVPNEGDYKWYNPFNSTWSKMQPNGGWPVGSVLTQLQRPSGRLQAILTSTTSDGVVRVRLHPQAKYAEGLAEIAPRDHRIPLSELAVWRYRFGLPQGIGGDVDDLALADSLALELNLSQEERHAIFSEEAAPQIGDTDDESALASDDDEWDVSDLVAALPPPEAPQAVEPAPIPPRNEPALQITDYRALEAVARLPLEEADVDALVGRAQEAAMRRGLLLPDPELLEQCVLALLTGHLVLQGPPGTGKTTLARVLAAAFECDSTLQTATADWSTYDVIGGLQPSVGADDREVLRPWLGHVPRAAIACAHWAQQRQENPDTAYQGHWLIIDEFSRAQVDKAIGALYTLLGGSGEQSLDLWFETDPARKVVPIPSRFRIIATMNDVDASFVYDFSQGLSRRFQFLYVGVPSQDDLDEEIKAALSHAAEWLVAQYPSRAGTTSHVALFERWTRDPRMRTILDQMNAFVSRVRYPAAGAVGGGWPLGTAQLGDVLKRVALREDGATDLLPVLDAALADRVIPQMSGVKPVILQDLLGWLTSTYEEQLPRTIRAARHLRDTSATA
ncbi:AAA family ATPase [Blastococcus sp. SYSU DS0973]